MKKRSSCSLDDPWLWRMFLVIDQFVGVVMSLIPMFKKLGFGHPDETISSVVGKQYYWFNSSHWFISGLYALLEWIDPGHCMKSIEHDRGLPRQC